MAIAELKSSLAAFSTLARSIRANGKSKELRVPNRCFRAPGFGGVQEAGATLEFRIAAKSSSAQLEAAFAEARNIALGIGPHGLGRWQGVECRAADQRFIEIEELDEESATARTEARVIPALLPRASENRVPLFARQLHRVDLHATGDAKHRAAMQELVQAILGTSGRVGGGF